MLVLTRSMVRSAVSMAEAIEACEQGLASYSAGQAVIPVRTPVEAELGVGLFMPGLLRDTGAMGIKIVSVFAQNPSRGLPTVTALMVLNDSQTGEPLAAMEAGYLTALRTGAAAGIATKYLARDRISCVAVFGAGVQARTQVSAVLAVRTVERITAYDIDRDAALSFADDMREEFGVDTCVADTPAAAVSGADVVIAATTSKTPVFDGRLISPGTHVNAIGAYTPDTRELDDYLVVHADKFVCDSKEALWAEAGDILIPFSKGLVSKQRVDAELGELVLGKKEGRTNDEQISVYKGVGIAALDLAVAQMVYARAKASNLGISVDMFS